MRCNVSSAGSKTSPNCSCVSDYACSAICVKFSSHGKKSFASSYSCIQYQNNYSVLAAWHLSRKISSDYQEKKNKPSTTGCIKAHSLFFIPAGKTFFKLDTWVQLYEIYEFTPEDIDTNKDITVEASLDVKIIDEIVTCLFEAEEDNIAPIHKKLLRPPLQESLLKLKEKFDKDK